MADNDTPQGDNPVPVEQKPEIDWKAEARKHEDRSKEWKRRAEANEGAAQRLAELEEAQKTEAQKAQERLEAAEKRAVELELKATRAEVAAAKSVPVELLSGSTQEELEASADALIAFRGETPTPQEQKPVSTIGTQPQTRAVPLNEQIAAAEAAGDKGLVAQLKAVQLGSIN